MVKEKTQKLLVAGLTFAALLFPNPISAQQKINLVGDWRLNKEILDLITGDTLIMSRAEDRGSIEFFSTGDFYKCEKQYYCIHTKNSYARTYKCKWVKAGTWELDNGQLKMKLADKTVTMINIENYYDRMKFVVKQN